MPGPMVWRTWEGWIPADWPAVLANGDASHMTEDGEALVWEWEADVRAELGGRPLSFEFGERDEWRTLPAWMGGDGPAVYVTAHGGPAAGSTAELDALAAELDALP